MPDIRLPPEIVPCRRSLKVLSEHINTLVMVEAALIEEGEMVAAHLVAKLCQAVTELVADRAPEQSVERALAYLRLFPPDVEFDDGDDPELTDVRGEAWPAI